MKIPRYEPIVWHEAKNGMYLESPYNKEFVDEMRMIVPKKERYWNEKRGTRGQWWISDLFIDEVDNLLFQYFGRYGEGRS